MKLCRRVALVALLIVALLITGCGEQGEEEGAGVGVPEVVADEESIEGAEIGLGEEPVAPEDPDLFEDYDEEEEIFTEDEPLDEELLVEEPLEVDPLEEGVLTAVPDPGDEDLIGEEEGEIVSLEQLAEIAADPTIQQEPLVFQDTVAEVVDEYGFTFGEEGILAVSTDPAGFDEELLTPGTGLRFEGTVGTFDLDVFEDRYGAYLAEEVYERFEGAPYIQIDPRIAEYVD